MKGLKVDNESREERRNTTCETALDTQKKEWGRVQNETKQVGKKETGTRGHRLSGTGHGLLHRSLDLELAPERNRRENETKRVSAGFGSNHPSTRAKEREKDEGKRRQRDVLLKLIGGRLLNLELLKSLGELGLNGGLRSPLDLEGELGSGDGGLDLVDVGLEVGLRKINERMKESQQRARERRGTRGEARGGRELTLASCRAWKSLSAALNCSASLIIWSISADDSRPTELRRTRRERRGSGPRRARVESRREGRARRTC